MRKFLNKLVTITCLSVICVPVFSTYVNASTFIVQNVEYTYENDIYKNGFEDTYLFETTDSVVTTKTGLSRTIPETFGRYSREEYPIPNVSQPGSEEKFNLIKEENIEIMDKVETDIQNGTLKKHISADGQFYGSIPNDVKAVEKIVYFNTNLKGSHSLAVYIPAGEIATVTIPEEYLYLAEQGKLKIRVGLVETNADNYGRNNGVENRMPRLGKEFTITDTTTKVGTPFGGMVYLFCTTDTPDELTIPVTVSGAVDTPYYDLCSTTKEQWDIAKNAPGLYAEFRTPYIRFMVPSSTIRNIEDPYDILSFWHNVASLSTYPFGAQSRTLPISMIFDPYVAVGAAYATAWICNMPTSWATGSLSYDSIMKSGCWGTIHEFNHHWQGTYNSTGRWGIGDPTEVTNNVMNAASYILYTNIACGRNENGISDTWNKIADPYCNLKNVLDVSKTTPDAPINSPFMYASFMHEFGVQTYLEVIRSNYYGGTYNGVTLPAYNSGDSRYDDLAYRTCVVVGKDLSYYFKDVLHFALSDETIQKIKSLNFEQYIPVQNLYAAGIYGIETGRPYYIPNSEYTFHFNKYMVSPGDVEIIEVGKPKYGTLTPKNDGTYLYTPNKNLPANTVDEFTLKVKVSANGVTQERTLICKPAIEYNTSKIETYDISNSNTDTLIEQAKNISPASVSYSQTVNYTTVQGNNLTKGTGYFNVSEDGIYEFQAYGDDKIKFILNVDGKDYTSTTNTYTAGVGNAYSSGGCTHFTVTLKKDTPYQYVLYANNTGGAGAGKVAYRKLQNASDTNSDVSTFQNLPSPYQDMNKITDKTFKLPENPYYERPLYKQKDKIVLDLDNAQVLKTPAAQGSDGNVQSMLDGDYSTFFHSRWWGNGITPFPHEYIIDLGEEKTFNEISIYTRASNTNGTIGDYEIYVANEYNEDNTKWNLIAEDKTRQNNNVSTTISADVDYVTARYLKINALNNKDENNNFTIISEIEVSNKTPINKVIAQNSSLILYNGNWTKNVNGNYINGATYNSTNGSVCYGFSGTETAIYSLTDAVINVSIDFGDFKQYNIKGSSNSPSIILNNLSDEIHTIQIDVLSGELSLNALSTNGTFCKYFYTPEPEPDPTPDETNLYVTSNVYKIDNDIILKIKPETSFEDLKKNIITNANGITIEKKNNSDTKYICTGDKLTFNLNGNLKTYTLVVVGDVMSDGELNVSDLSKLKKFMIGLAVLEHNETLAADINDDGEVDV